MESMGEWELRSLINELTQGRELARQLQIYLNVPSSSSLETRELLALKIQASYEKALSMLNCNTSLAAAAADQSQLSGLAIRMSESPSSRSVSPRSEDSDRDYKEQDLKLDASKKRKTLPRWTQQVRVTPGIALEGPLDDGFSWRKYGQKDILGAKYPRGYYRCTHRNVQGCLARKQVQRSDEDPTIFEITYRGMHTCNLASHVMPPSGALSGNQEQGTSIEPHNQQAEQSQKQSQDLLSSFQRGLKVITEDLDKIREQIYPSSMASNIKVEDNVVFSSPSVMGNNYNVGGNVSHSFLSPATSGTNYFSVSPIPSGAMNSDHLLGNVNFPTPEPQQQLTEIIQASNSTTNSPTVVGLDFLPFGSADQFNPNFTFDNQGFFP